MGQDHAEDLRWIRRALAEAARGLGRVEPNPAVGAALVRDGRLVAVGHHPHFGGPHAEVMALETAGESARGADLYVTLEPCRHWGKTPPCTEAIHRAGVARVVAAIRDPFPAVDGGGFAQLRAFGIAVEVGALAQEAAELIAPFRKLVATGRPFVTAKWAMTLDGKAAAGNGESRWISGPASRASVHETRGRMDAIAVGIGTALADDPSLTARPAGPRVATRIVLDPSARLPMFGQLVRTAREVPVLVAVARNAPSDRIARLEAAGCEVVRFPDSERIPIVELLDLLGNRRITNLLLEGGGWVAGAFFDAGEVDAVDAYLAPILEGGDHSRTPARGLGLASMADATRLVRPKYEVLDGDVRVRGRVRQPWDQALA